MENMNQQTSATDLVSQLRTEASKNPAFNAVAHIFAMRERSRREVTLNSLAKTMRREGYDFDKDVYANVLRFMADTGLGTLDLNRAGRPKALKGLKVTLQSIGLAALAQTEPLKKAKPQNGKKLAKLSTIMPQSFVDMPKRKPIPPPLQALAKTEGSTIKVTVTVNGNALVFELPPSLISKGA